jgi:transcriptional regulator with XRE-family HTH domain
MLKQEELVKSPEYWLETMQNEIFRQVTSYLKDNHMTQTQLSIQLGVSKGYISQVMKGEFNYTLKKLIELSLAVGKAPVLSFKTLTEINQSGQKEDDSSSTPSFNRVADPIEPYACK